MKQRILFCFLLIISVTSCIDPYYLELEDYESLLVVEGMNTDEPASYTIRLSRTFQNEKTSPERVTNAEVWVLDESGMITVFHELEPGVYLHPHLQF